MKYIYQIVQTNINNEVTYSGDFYASKNKAIKIIKKKYSKEEDFKFHPWQYCKITKGILHEEWDTYQIIKVAYNTKGEQQRIGIITHKLY